MAPALQPGRPARHAYRLTDKGAALARERTAGEVVAGEVPAFDAPEPA